MKPQLLADMGISPSVVGSLRQQGYDAIHLQEQGLHRLTDQAVLEKARSENRVILTSDLDFGNLMAAAGPALPSVVIFRLKDMTPASVERYLTLVLNNLSEVLAAGALVSVSERGCRVHRLPVGGDRS